MRKGDYIQTYTGAQFWPLDPRAHEVRLTDIAHALSNICRYTGHCKSFYSVAQHSVLVSLNVPEEHAKWGLLHDSAESYIADLARPLKHHSFLGDEYRQVEAGLMRAICERFKLPMEEPAEVKEADNRLLMTEKRDLMGIASFQWKVKAEPLPETIRPMLPLEAKDYFLRRAHEIGL